ncbi:alpha/beta hydrolase [Winogradskyella sp.]|jgi:pimeloyl-ACP methyl ester carboxylesterase|uniref:alpha/beta fold hydrolase n=1 Tax=Winogradskyella sp. TaxID=1883156 RepID=UPI0025F40237|nr:alpha/beta hydrolase [Winogradskyella sp.]MCT4628299.1 alpha/beta hydrolase [Winogradskyella sp.]
MILDYKNIAVHYTVSGEGSTVVLLHGFLETVAMWKEIVPEFSRSHQVVCIDLLGHGETDCLGYVHTMEDMAGAVFAVLNHLNIEKGVFIGHSMGGYVALALAEKEPQLFEGLCLMNSTFEDDNEDRKLLRTRANEMAKTNFENLVRMSFANLFATESRISFKSEYNNALQTALNTSVQGYIAANEGMKLRPNRFETFKTLNAHKLIIVGKKDNLINSSCLKNCIENTSIQFEELSEGHMSHIENIPELSYLLLLFIEK